jgi:hypothetical protein
MKEVFACGCVELIVFVAGGCTVVSSNVYFFSQVSFLGGYFNRNVVHWSLECILNKHPVSHIKLI